MFLFIDGKILRFVFLFKLIIEFYPILTSGIFLEYQRLTDFSKKTSYIGSIFGWYLVVRATLLLCVQFYLLGIDLSLLEVRFVSYDYY